MEIVSQSLNTALLNGAFIPHFVSRDSRWPERGKSGGKDDRETKKQGIHVRKHLIKEKETKAKELKRSESGENEIKVRQA